jgi:hypothetical protein
MSDAARKCKRSLPVEMRVLDGVDSRFAMQSHTCAVLVGGAVRCWGNSNYGQVMLCVFVFDSRMRFENAQLDLTPCDLSQLGVGSQGAKLTPFGVVGLSSGVSSIALGGVRLLFYLLVVQTLCCHAVAGDDVACVVFS